MRRTLLVYAASAAAFALSAGLHAAAVLAANQGNPSAGHLALAGGIAILVGIPLVVTALGFLLLSSNLLPHGLAAAPAYLRDAVWWGGAAVRVGCFLLFPAVALTFLGTAYRGGAGVLAGGFAASAASALAFLAGIALLPLVYGETRSRLYAAVAVTLGSAAVIGEAALSIGGISRPVIGPIWLTLGGIPLINWNLPLGATVAAASLVLWWSYQAVAKEAGQAVPSPG